MQVIKDVLGDLSLCWSSCSSKVIEVTVEPLVDFPVDGMVVVTNLSWSLVVCTSLCLSCSTILVSATHVDTVVANQTGKSSIDISRENTANDVSKMRHIVDVGQSTGDQNITSALLW